MTPLFHVGIGQMMNPRKRMFQSIAFYNVLVAIFSSFVYQTYHLLSVIFAILQAQSSFFPEFLGSL
jgi:hypothetical protein